MKIILNLPIKGKYIRQIVFIFFATIIFQNCAKKDSDSLHETDNETETNINNKKSSYPEYSTDTKKTINTNENTESEDSSDSENSIKSDTDEEIEIPIKPKNSISADTHKKIEIPIKLIESMKPENRAIEMTLDPAHIMLSNGFPYFDNKLDRSIGHFSEAFAKVKLKDTIGYSETIQWMKDAIKLGLIPKEFEETYNRRTFTSIEELEFNVRRNLEHISFLLEMYGNKPHAPFFSFLEPSFLTNTSDYTDNEKYNACIGALLNHLQSLQMIESVIHNNKTIDFPQEDIEIIKEESQRYKNFLNEKNKLFPIETGLLANPENLQEAKKYLPEDLDEFLYGKPIIDTEEIEGGTITSTTYIARMNSIMDHWEKSESLRNTISKTLFNLVSLYSIYNKISPESNIEDLQQHYPSIYKNIEYGEDAIEKLRKILNEKKTYIDKEDGTERIGLRWVGQWKKNGSEKQISVDQATKLISILDWMSAFTIYLKTKGKFEVPVINTQAMINLYNNRKLWIKESDEERNYRETKRLENGDPMAKALYPVEHFGILGIPALLATVPYYALKS